MMPLPWLMVFLMIFFCVYSVSLFVGSFFFSGPSLEKAFTSTSVKLPW